ncbi:hypothetical protein [Actinoplanes nipponensis]|nr:hypothetical protein [Actinoplanes nipponensis]
MTAKAGLNSLAGDDKLYGLAGPDTLTAGGGHDTVVD